MVMMMMIEVRIGDIIIIIIIVHRVPEQLNIKAVTGACKLIDGCSLELCSATPSVAYATEMKSIQLHDFIVMALP